MRYHEEKCDLEASTSIVSIEERKDLRAHNFPSAQCDFHEGTQAKKNFGHLHSSSQIRIKTWLACRKWIHATFPRCIELIFS
jgi:hypothetical protein